MSCGYDSSFGCNADPLGPSMAEMCNSSTVFVFMSLVNEMIRSNPKISGLCNRVKPIDVPNKVYDFVIIGGGGAGSAIAGRLSENQKWNTLLLEAGSDEPASGQVPAFTEVLIRTKVDWNYTTSNESHACLSRNGSCAVSSGKMLGGCTAHNAMVYLRGNPTDYNNWAEQGNEGWTWEEVKEFYLKLEDNGEIERVGRKYHSTGGPVSVERFPFSDPFGNFILAAAAEIGYQINDDLNGEHPSGFAITQTTTKNGVRHSSARSYLWPVRNRKNLHISLDSLATKVIIENNTAVGVEYYKNGVLNRVSASREVIISAGSLRSAQILLLSGIGPEEHLRSMGIKVIKDLPGVGENLHDQVTYPLYFTANETEFDSTDYETVAQYLINQTGPLSGIGFATLMAVLNTKASSPEYPNLQLHFGRYPPACAPGPVNTVVSPEQSAILARVVNLHPKSRGRISLASNNPFDYPVIWFNYLGDPRDVEVLIDGIKMALELADTQALRPFNFTVLRTPIEACSKYTFGSTEYWTCAVRQNTSPEIHSGGSCKMGPSSDPMAVVDPQLRVHGIKGLRVGDNSIMPVVTSGNTQAPAMMIGERVADFIKKYWNFYNKG